MKKLVWLALCCMASLAFWAGGAWGANFCVDNATDLQNALNTAAGNSADDTIKVVQGTYTGNFTYNSNVGLGITLEGGYTAGCAAQVFNPANTILDGGNTGGVLSLSNNNGGNIRVQGFTIRNGSSGSAGGGVYAWSQSTSGPAGHIYLGHNIIRGNSAQYDGGVFAYSRSDSGTAGTVTLTNNTITGNSSAWDSGGVYAFSGSTSGTAGTVTITNNTVTGNSTAHWDGGGVQAISASDSGTAGDVVLANNIVAGNAAGADDGGGGGVLAASFSHSDAAGTVGTVTCTNNTITGNSAYIGGGTYLSVNGSTGGMVNAYNNIVWGNTAPHGNDIYLDKGTSGVANGYNNDYATMSGSWTNASNNINVNPLFVNPVNGDYRLQSGSPCKDAGDNNAPNLPSTDFEGVPRIIDGIVDIGADEVSILATCVSTATGLLNALTAARTNGKGDVIMVVQGTYTGHFGFSSSEGKSITLLGGYTAGCAGRVVDPSLTVLDGGNTGRVLYLYNTNGGWINVQGFTIQNGNVGSGNGGGVDAEASSDSGTAGFVYLGHNIIRGNSTQLNGGGATAYSYTSSGAAGDVVLANNIVAGNAADGNGGGVSTASFATSGGTAGIITVTNNTVSGNTAGAYGGGTYLDVHGSTGGMVNAYNNIVWGNTAPTGGDIYLDKGTSGVAYAYNNYSSAPVGSSWDYNVGNIDADPLFVGSGDYHLRATSPCIDAGFNSAPGIPATDFEGDYRIIDGNRNGTATVDIGADEFIRWPILEAPADGTMFFECSLINKYQPAFRWTVFEPFKSFTIFFSTSSTDFSTKGVLITKANIKGTKRSYTPSSGTWKKIMMASNNNGGSIRPIFWKIVGNRADKTTAESAVRNVRISGPFYPWIDSPDNGVELHAATPPTFQFDTMCNIKFRLEISTLSDFSDPKKIKAFAYSVKDPNITTTFQKTLSSGQWKAVQKLIGTGRGYFRIKGWDVIKRETASETRSFTITTP